MNVNIITPIASHIKTPNITIIFFNLRNFNLFFDKLSSGVTIAPNNNNSNNKCHIQTPFIFYCAIIHTVTQLISTVSTAKMRCYCKKLCLCYSIILVTTPAPTVLPPSRIAKRSPSSIAIGVINSTKIASRLSPGITISTPSGKVNEPVTSVVRK